MSEVMLGGAQVARLKFLDDVIVMGFGVPIGAARDNIMVPTFKGK